jgi:hypothetical protein
MSAKLVYKRHYLFGGRSSSAAKKTDAALKMALARFNLADAKQTGDVFRRCLARLALRKRAVEQIHSLVPELFGISVGNG